MFLRFCVGGKGISIPNGNGDMLADGNDGLLHSAAWVGNWNVCSGNSFYPFPFFTVRPKKQAGNELAPSCINPAFHLREVLAGGHNVVHKEHIASLKIDGMKYEVGELVKP